MLKLYEAMLNIRFLQKFTILSVFLSYFLFIDNAAAMRNHIKIVGSSTVYPFTTIVAEEFGYNTDFRTPIVESTGTGEV